METVYVELKEFFLNSQYNEQRDNYGTHYIRT